MDLELRDKRVLITGASQGIGEGIAEVTALPRKIRTRFMAEPAGLQVEVLHRM
mgnify:CR=1 FL=1